RETEKLRGKKEVCEQQEKEWERRLAETEAHLSGLLEDRGKRISGMDPELVQTYARIYEVRQGLAVVPVKDRSCSGCFVTLTPQAFQEARRNDRILTCPNCNRILYWKE
ncbi:MAG: C4-type zinc ribbon domain-containing protein, partial [candidate division NC10 bacterium]|nr:C4-type zinc ribbon domain-containing protein [candidate division NC10 bacterium]